MNTKQAQARAKAARKAIYFNSGGGIASVMLPSATAANPKSGKNFYKVKVDMDLAALKAWLVENGCPGAAASAKAGAEYQAELEIAGNVSALSLLAVFGGMDLRFTWEAIGDSLPLHTIDGGVKRSA